MAYLLFSEIKMLMNDLGFDRSDVEGLVDEVSYNESQFTIGKYRFINADKIDDIMQEELSGDEYMLGCFNAWFIADVLGIDQDVIDEMQKAEAFTAIGKLILSMGMLGDLQQAYASADGYGHHFDGYDGSENEMIFEDSTLSNYYYFRE